jgi:hypothetical protein
LLQTLRDMMVSMGPLLLLGGGLLVAAYWWLDPQPPRQVRLATGPAGSAYAAFGEGYAKALARELSPTAVMEPPMFGILEPATGG